MILLQIIIFISVYLLADKLSKYTLLSNYTWFDMLSIKLYYYKGKLKNILSKIYYSKLFNCLSCNVFWLSLCIYSILSIFMNVDILVYSLLTFLIHKIENV